jgi:hypothetical protein
MYYSHCALFLLPSGLQTMQKNLTANWRHVTYIQSATSGKKRILQWSLQCKPEMIKELSFFIVGYFMTLSVARSCNIIWYNDRWTGKDMESSNQGLTKLLSQHLPGGTEEIHENLHYDRHGPGWVSNSLPKYKPRVLPLCWVLYHMLNDNCRYAICNKYIEWMKSG